MSKDRTLREMDLNGGIIPDGRFPWSLFWFCVFVVILLCLAVFGMKTILPLVNGFLKTLSVQFIGWWLFLLTLYVVIFK